MELQKHESAPPVSGKEERGLALAVNEPQLFKQPVEGIKEVLRYCFVLVGLRANNFPDDTEKAVLINWIYNNYGGHTLSEIKLAFEMAVAGKLDVEVNTYENFSVLYFSNIMNAYQLWSREAIKHAVKPYVEPVVLDVSDADYLHSVREVYKATGKRSLIPELAYKMLEQEINLTREEKIEIKRKVVEVNSEASELEIKLMCKQYAVEKYFNDRVSKDTEGI